MNLVHNSNCCCCLVANSCPALCNPMDCSTPGFPVLHHLLVCSNSCPLSQCSIQPSHPLLPVFLPLIFPRIRVFCNELALHIKWSFSFRIRPSNEYSGLISFRIDWFDLLAVQGTLKSCPTAQYKSINSSALSFLYSSTLTSIHDYWKNHSFDCMELCWQSNVSAF